MQLADPIKPSVEPATIVVVDHDAAVRDALSLTLSASGFSVLTCGSAGELLAALPIRRKVCLLVEFDLKDMDGAELLARLAATQIELPIVIMCARLRLPILERQRAPGVAAILQKPFGQAELLRCLRHALSAPG